MEDLLNSITSCIRHEQYYGALTLALMIPSIAAAICSEDNRDSEPGYIKWFDENVKLECDIKGLDCYKLRCKLLHQGISGSDKSRNDKKASSFTNFIFVLPSNNFVNNNKIIQNNRAYIDVELELFCRAIVVAARTWMDSELENQLIQGRLKETVSQRYHPLLPIPVIM